MACFVEGAGRLEVFLTMICINHSYHAGMSAEVTVGKVFTE